MKGVAYRHVKGFFDLTNRPKGLSEKLHRKMQETQMSLVEMQENAEYYKKYLPSQWQRAQEVSADLQQLIFKYYPHEQLFS